MKLTKTIIPIIGSTETGNPCPVGSGILLAVGSERFLITAAHVLDENKITSLYLPGESELIEISGPARQSRPPKNDRSLDHLDTAYVHLSDEIVCRISKVFWFLSPEFIDVSDVSTEGKHYMFTGYPHKAIEPSRRKRKISAQLHSYTDLASGGEVYARVNANPDLNIVINFDAKQAKDENGRTVTPKERRGMSGGGVWNAVSGPRVLGMPNVRLCGVAIEHHKKHKCLVATKINFVLESIRADFPALSELLPVSETLDVVMGDS